MLLLYYVLIFNNFVYKLFLQNLSSQKKIASGNHIIVYMSQSIEEITWASVSMPGVNGMAGEQLFM